MKLFVFFSVATMLAFFSCNNDEDISIVNSSSLVLSCHFVDLDMTKSIEWPVDKIEFFFFNLENDDYSQYIIQKKGDASFGVIKDTFPCGAYDCVVVAHSSNSSLEDGILSFDKVSETFRGIESFELEKGVETSFSINLIRINSRIEIVASDPLTADASTVIMNIENVADNFDLLTGLPLAPYTLKRSFLLRKEDIGKSNLKFSANMFVQKTPSVLTIEVLSEDGSSISKIKTEPFTLLSNFIFRFTGFVFHVTTSPSGQIDIDTEWDGIEENELPLSS